MTLFDEKTVPQIPSSEAESPKLLYAVNANLREVYRYLHYLEGRFGEPEIRDHLRVTGRVCLKEDPSTELHEVGTGEVQFNGLTLSLAPVHAVRVYRATAQSIVTATSTDVSWSHQLIDTPGTLGQAYMWRATDPTRVYIEQPGLYLVGSDINFAANSTGIRQVRIFADISPGSTVPEIIAAVRTSAASAGVTTLSTSGLYRFPSMGHVTVRVFQDSGGNLDISTLTGTSQITIPSLWAFRLFAKA